MKRRQDRGRVHRPLCFAIALACSAGSASAATVTVGSVDDSAASVTCNLRNAIVSINGGAATANCVSSVSGAFGDNDAIVFDAALVGATITLAQGELAVTASMGIAGSGQVIQGDPAGARLITATASLNLDHLTLSGGTTTDAGGAIYASSDGATLTLSNTTVSGNHADGKGGGIAVRGHEFILSNSIVTANTSNSYGGGLNVEDTHATISGSTIADNIATCTADTYCTGGLYVAGAQIDISQSTISGNSATCTADVCTTIGGVYAWVSSVSIINSTITGNHATGPDAVVGGVWESHANVSMYPGFLSLTNTTIAGNSATATSTTATDAAGGVMIGLHYDTGAMTAANSIIAANTATSSGNASPTPDVDIDAANFATATIAFSLLGNATSAAFAGNGNVFTDTPGLGPLQNNGGPTMTMALLAGSIAIDAGSNALAVDAGGQPLTTDQTGATRIFNAVVDIGAFESDDRIFTNGFEL